VTEAGPVDATGALLARKGTATPAGFKGLPPQRTAKKTERRGFKLMAVWLLPMAAIAVVAALATSSIMTRDEITVAVTSPLDSTQVKIEPFVGGEIIEAPEPPFETRKPAALEDEPAAAALAEKELLPPPLLTPPMPARKVAAKPVYLVQLHALGSKEMARREWRKIKRSNDDLFGQKKMILLSGKNKISGIRFVRLQAGPFGGFRDAQNLCGKAKKRRLACVVVQR
jgi:hypothetical protein